MDERNRDMMPEDQLKEESLRAEQPGVEDAIYTAPDVYQAQTGLEIYQTPGENAGRQYTGGLFSGGQTEGSAGVSGYGVNQYAPDVYAGIQNNNNGYGMNGNQYQYGNSGYVSNQNQYGYNGAGENPYQYGNNGSNAGENPYQYGNNAASGGQYQYGNNAAFGNPYQYGNNASYGNPYQYGNNAAGGNQYGNSYGYNRYGYNNPYSPYAAPQKKKHIGLIIGIVISIVVIFLIALLAIIYNAFKSIYENKVSVHSALAGSENNTDNDNDDGYSHRYDYDNRNDNDDNDYDEQDFDDDDEYYTFHDDIKNDLSYSIKWEDYEYDADNENVLIYVNYPVIVGDDVPNLDKINEVIAREASVFTGYYEEKYSKYMKDNEDGYFAVLSDGYVTYMSESVLSVVFQEEIDSDYFGAVYLYCINIDMTTGVIMENTDIIDVDDDFSVDFRIRSDKQNGYSSELDNMSDQEITKHLKSTDDLIVFYTPQGMEIGINYGDGYGWITVTYHDYKKYLKVF